MKLHISLWLLFLSAFAMFFSACTEDNEEISATEYANWTFRNDSAFSARLNEAKTAIAQAKQTYGTAWEANCPYRILVNYKKISATPINQSDSIPVYINTTGGGSGCPLYSDSVRVNYYGRLIPTEHYPDGFVFGFSGSSSKEADVFDKDLCSPALFSVKGNTTGFATALMYMHIGDVWTISVPPDLAYGETATSSIPAHSMLTFKMELKAFYRPGARDYNWK